MTHRSKLATIHDREGRLIRITPEFSRIFSVSPETIKNARPPYPWWPEESVDVLLRAFEFVLSEEGSRFQDVEFTTAMRTANQTERPFVVSFERLADGSTALYLTPAHFGQAIEELTAKANELFELDRLESDEIQAPEEILRIDKLSQREQTVLDLFVHGKRVAEVSEALHISVHTARNHRKSIFSKLGVRSQVELMSRIADSSHSPTPWAPS